MRLRLRECGLGLVSHLSVIHVVHPHMVNWEAEMWKRLSTPSGLPLRRCGLTVPHANGCRVVKQHLPRVVAALLVEVVAHAFVPRLCPGRELGPHPCGPATRPRGESGEVRWLQS